MLDYRFSVEKTVKVHVALFRKSGDVTKRKDRAPQIQRVQGTGRAAARRNHTGRSGLLYGNRRDAPAVALEQGRIVLVGDAAHSSSPFMGQGGAMALEDGPVLAEMPAGADDVPSACSTLSERRFERCKFVQEQSRRVGQAGAVENLEATTIRDERMRSGAQRDVDTFYARIGEPI